MALCSLCSTLPFNGFPAFSPSDRPEVAGDDEFVVAHFPDPTRTESKLPDHIGVPYHENLGALAESAKTCSLCALVQAGVQAWLVSWNKCAGTKTFVTAVYPYPFSGAFPLEERLWLTGITPKIPGFCVWTKAQRVRTDVLDDFNFYLLTMIGFSVEENSPLKNQFPLRIMDSDSGSPRSLDRAASWVQNCVDNHQNCSDGSDALLPSRVLDVEVEGDTISLVDGSSVSGKSGKYACLSYCWGHSPPFTTTRATMQARQSAIALKEMPQTFKDAVTITRRLGLKYLWIDSLCICQDDSEDWARESGLMADVYSNAYVVIAANRSSDCNGGCFHERAPREKALHIPILESREYINMTRLSPSDHGHWPNIDFSTEPLSQRGWVLQERTMARRTLHYNDRQMYFECFLGMEAEDGAVEKFARNGYHWNLTKNGDYQKFNSPEDAISNWYSLIHEFSQRKLSRATDKLPALSGWAKKFQKEIGADYVAGLWSKELVKGLLWRCKGERKPASLEEYTGPSWSWASCGGTVDYHASADEVLAEVLDWHVELKEAANPFGEVRDAWIKICGRVSKLKPWSSESDSEEDEFFEETAPALRVSVSATVRDSWYHLHLDDQSFEESGEWKDWDLQVMLLCGHFEWEGWNVAEGIVIREVTRAGQRGKWERVGSMSFMGDDANWVQWNSRPEDWMTITLV